MRALEMKTKTKLFEQTEDIEKYFLEVGSEDQVKILLVLHHAPTQTTIVERILEISAPESFKQT